ncbi:polysaccharide biosynthesis/export family protein [Maribellus maritimus]|uniref:polysaccharide biosynthesis/export family protein n=1 Tax=Maribellus maritimus TaxID=2870838 RepID=UPI001EEC928D|nr:polysaccharide biosynthesis/export family protein [Maribellus maritimus]MCG6190251.1 polysaccharide biosynthesis/export family protein [Maribellus maritimus]
MKRILIFYFALLTVIFLTSCRSSKDLTMFQDLRDNVSLYKIPEKAPEYFIKPFDNLYLSILTLDPQVNQLFNPSTAGGTGVASGTQQMYGDRASQYINGYMVTEEGFITLPILGQIAVAGLNLQEAQERIKQRAEEYLKEPNVKVKVLNFKVNVTGEVEQPGLYYNYEGSLNIIDALSMANGITQFADLQNVLVIRHNEDVTKTYNLNLTDKSVYLSDVFYLQPNDIVYVKPNRFKRSSENNNIYSLILSTVSTILVAATVISNY